MYIMTSFSVARALAIIILVASVTLVTSGDKQDDAAANSNTDKQQQNFGYHYDDEHTNSATMEVLISPAPHQLNCNLNSTICNVVCNETKRIPYSSTFCDTSTGSCVCDCRDNVPKKCEKTPFTPCFQECVRKNPNPDVFLYEGVNCPIPQENGTIFYQCACECTVRDDYEETNDIF